MLSREKFEQTLKDLVYQIDNNVEIDVSAFFGKTKVPIDTEIILTKKYPKSKPKFSVEIIE